MLIGAQDEGKKAGWKAQRTARFILTTSTYYAFYLGLQHIAAYFKTLLISHGLRL